MKLPALNIKPTIMLLTLCIAVVGPFGCVRPSIRTMPGPENPALISGLQGYIVIDRSIGGIVGEALPALQELVIRHTGPEIGTVHSVSGPDSLGRVAFIENHYIEKRHLVKVMRIDGSGEEVVVERPGDTLWSKEIGDHLALAPAGGLVAFVTNLSTVKMRKPRAYFQRGRIAIWDVDTKDRLPTGTTALDDKLCWFPDGRHLAYVDLMNRDEAVKVLRKHVDPTEDYGTVLIERKQVPVVHVMDTTTGRTEALHVGLGPVVSADGTRVLMRDFEGRWRMLDLNRQQSQPVSAPGRAWPGAIALFDANLVLYWAWPTDGTELRWTQNNSLCVGPKPMLTLKVADLRTGDFRTVVPYIDPRRDVSYGAGAVANK
ncbi:MAG: hypothetical protein IH889_05795 [Planctomycetes bacterium]|nr:hypothetical protein [Planctomycetota bacterium]